MTMIAGFKIDDMPFLLGDFVTSIPESQTGGQYTITRSRKRPPSSPETRGPASTGNVHSAGQILDELFERFRNAVVSQEEIQGYLTSRKADSTLLKPLVCHQWERQDLRERFHVDQPDRETSFRDTNPSLPVAVEIFFADMQRRLQEIVSELGEMEKLRRR